ncbi:MAG: hexose kinase [Cytophagales bacterium]|nr:hexose kinase [Cytophagales bacterium]
MKKIVTLTINPALDRSTIADKIIPEQKIRCESPVYEPGGGGINVSRAIKKLGGDSMAIFPAGGHTGELFKELILSTGIDFLHIPTKDRTRENFIVVDSQNNSQYRFGMPGPHLEESEWQKSLDMIESMREKPDYIVGSGSLSPGVPVDFYARLAVISKKIGARFILDTSGEALRAAANAGVYLLKPNLGELADMSGNQSLIANDIPEAAMSIIEKGNCEVVVVSMGPAGAMLVAPGIEEHVPAPTVHKQSTVGAGDSMVAGMTLSLALGRSLREVVRYGVACGTAATMNKGTELCKKENVDKLYDWINSHVTK